MQDQFLIVDIETTGLEIPPSCILEIGAMICDHDFNPVETKTFAVKPTTMQWQMASPKALEVNGITLDYLKAAGAKPIAEVGQDFSDFLDRHDAVVGDHGKRTFYVGQNPAFDIKFLRFYMATILNNRDFVYAPVIDIRELAKMYVRQANPAGWPIGGYGKPAFRGTDIAIGIGVEPEADIHTALGGVQAVHRNLVKLASLLEWRPK
jgi:DNA polymerase III epsilon subunit-like protein